MLNNKLLALMIPLSLLGACSVTGPADDGFENSNEWVDNGRLLSVDDGGYTIYRSTRQQGSASAPRSDADPLASDELDYAAYRQWLEAKGTNSPAYRKFKQWQEFEDFQRWKEQGKTE